jgi:hypothetical protein
LRNLHQRIGDALAARRLSTMLEGASVWTIRVRN